MPTSYLIHRTLYSPQISKPPNANLGIIVVIPCYNEENLISSLQSLYDATLPNCAIEIIVVINDGQNTNVPVKLKNQETLGHALFWAARHSDLRKQFHIFYQSDLPAKKAGVGLARKIGMDEAVFRFEAVNKPDGIIVGFDADSICQKDYFISIENHFRKYPKIQATSIWYEHPLEGEDFDQATYDAICQYELHLRYFTLAKRFANYPHAFETIGSSMAVRSDAYQQQGGMNTRKAGEDFYFLNKFIVLGKLNELKETKVIPSPRVSDRVPFGTGKAVGELLQEKKSLRTYSYKSFIDLKGMVELVPAIYDLKRIEWDKLSEPISHFLKSINAEQKVKEILENTTDFISFEKRFYRWFDPFMIMKYAHHCRDHFYENIPVMEAGQWIMENYFNKRESIQTEKNLLLEIRKCWLNSSEY